MKKLLMLVSNSCDPDPRVEFEAKALSKDYDVEVIAWDRKCKSLKSEVRDGFRINRVLIGSNFGTGYKQIINFLKFYIQAFRQIRLKKPDYIHCHDLDTLLLGYFYKLLNNKTKLIYDAHEIYSEMSLKRNFDKRLCVIFEKMLLKKVDLFITVGEVRLDWYKKNKYKKKPIIIGNWKKGDMSVHTNQITKKEIYKILYIGSLNEERDLKFILDIVSKSGRFELIIAGSGAQEQIVKAYSERFSNISYLGYVKDKKIYNDLNSTCDVIYYGLDKEHPVSQTAVPNKMFEAISYNKIFYASFIGEILLFHNRYGVFVPVNNSRNDLDNLLDILDDKRKMKELNTMNVRLYEKYNEQNAVKTLISNYSALNMTKH